MITKIGIVAGDIWHYLDDHGKVKLGKLAKEIDRPRDNILLSVGWLAREGHVIVEGEGPDYNDYDISLRK